MTKHHIIQVGITPCIAIAYISVLTSRQNYAKIIFSGQIRLCSLVATNLSWYSIMNLLVHGKKGAPPKIELFWTEADILSSSFSRTFLQEVFILTEVHCWQCKGGTAFHTMVLLKRGSFQPSQVHQYRVSNLDYQPISESHSSGQNWQQQWLLLLNCCQCVPSP